MAIIRTEHLTKRYSSFTAVNNLSIEVSEGEIYGFVGLNGAGKTTTIRMLLGIIHPTDGSVYLFDKNIKDGFKQWSDVGYIVETVHAYPTLTVRENLELFAAFRKLYDRTRIDATLERFKLTEYQNVLVKHLLLENLQRLGLARALLHAPKLLILNEPLNGLDPAGIVEVREYFKELSLNGTTLFISSHLLEELSKLATKIGIIHRGYLFKERTTEELSSQLSRTLCVSTDDNDNRKAVNLLQEWGYQASINEHGTIRS
ncbi:MAG: ABC transporter ATP-binding protein [Bacteroidetes bacterium]|nr:ABC transporter ATP-binding protein [Bacteroidota bacterium]